jgi:hypothetical protein
MRRLATLLMTALYFGMLGLPLKAQNYDTARYWIEESIKSNADFYEIEAIMTDYFRRNEDARMHSRSYKSFNRWADFWRTRLIAHPDYKGNLKAASAIYELEMNQLNESPANTSAIGSDWGYIGPGEFNNLQVKGLIESLVVDPSDPTLQTIYAGTNASGIWKTTDGGKYWQCITDRSGYSNVGVQDIVIDPSNASVIYAATGISTYGRAYGSGIIKSINGGNSWFKLNFPEPTATVRKLSLQRGSSNNLVALYNPDKDNVAKINKIYVSKNAGASWYSLPSVPLSNLITSQGIVKYKYFLDIKFNPAAPNSVYLVSNGVSENSMLFSKPEIWKANNIFANDTNLVEYTRLDTLPGFPGYYCERLAIDINPHDGALYASGTFTEYISNTAYLHHYYLLKYNETNQEWESKYVHNNISQGYSDKFSGIDIWRNELCVSKKFNNVFYVGGFTIDKIDLRGSNPVVTHVYYGTYGPNYHVDTRALQVMIGSDGNEYIFAGNDGGVSRGNEAFQFTDINGKGLNITQAYGIGSPLNSTQPLATGTQDNGGFTRQQNSSSWIHANAGDAYDVVYHAQNPQVAYMANNGGSPGILLTTNNGQTWQGVPLHQNMYSQLALNDRPLIIHPSQPAYLYTGWHDVWRGTIGSNYQISEWENLTEFDSTLVSKGQRICAISIAPSNPQVIFMAFSEPAWKEIDSIQYYYKLWKTSNGGIDWNELLSSNYLLRVMTRYKPITDIAIHPQNYQKVWLSYGCYSAPGDPTDRIAHTEDGGFTWNKFSCNGLPNLPVNCMIAVNRDGVTRLFLGNDAGVYMYENADVPGLSWTPFNQNLPKCIVTDMEYNDAAKLLRISTFGRGLWETPLDCYTTSNDIVIPAGQVQQWARDTTIHGNVIVSGTLKILKTVKFMYGKGIFVEKGGKLIVEGQNALLTSHCGGRWLGIRVKGNPSMPFTVSGEHGTVELTQCRIEDAEAGVYTLPLEYLPDGPGQGIQAPSAYAGGIIKAKNVTFENNYIDISIAPSRIKREDILTNCTFRTSSLLKGFPVFPYAHIVISDAEGISIRGCTFSTDTTSFSWPLGIGIAGNHSNFTLKDTLGIMNQFYNLRYGIKANAVSPVRAVKIDKSVFKRCITGIYLSGMTQPHVWRCRFRIDATDTSLYKPYAGLYLDHCTGYSVTENNFYPGNANSTGNNSIRVGMVVNESGTQNNLIYNNKFKGLRIGLSAQNTNRSPDGHQGLTIQCNDFTTCIYDIAVLSATPGMGKGIRANQGYWGGVPGQGQAKDLANNLFSHYSFSGYQSIHDEVGNTILYYHADTLESTMLVRPIKSGSSVSRINATGLSFNKSVCCPPVTASGNDAEELKDDFIALADSISDKTLELQQMIDGGDTPGTLMEIQSGGQNQTPEVYASLMVKSPYLSDTVLKESILNEYVLSNPLLRDILVLNPQSAKNQYLLEILEQRWEPFPDEYLGDVLSNLEVLGQREAIESNLSRMKFRQDQIMNEIIEAYCKQSSPSATDSLYGFLEGQPLVGGKRILSALKANMHHFDEAIAVAASIETLPTASEADIAEALQLQSLISFFAANAESGRPFIYADSSNLEGLTQIMEAYPSQTAHQAMNILLANGLLSYDEPYLLPEPNLKKGKYIQKARNKNCFVDKITLFPNPAHDYILIIPSLEIENLPAMLSIYNMQGKSVYKTEVSQNLRPISFSVKNLPAGLYKVCLSEKYGSNDCQSFIVL